MQTTSSKPKSNVKGNSRSNSTQQPSMQAARINHQMMSNKKSTGNIENLTEFNKKYKKYLHNS